MYCTPPVCALGREEREEREGREGRVIEERGNGRQRYKVQLAETEHQQTP